MPRPVRSSPRSCRRWPRHRRLIPSGIRTPASIAQSEEMLALAQQYIPAADKPRERLGRVEAILALAQAQVRRRRRIEERPWPRSKQAVEAKDFKDAYRVRTALLNAYPQFSTYDAMTEAVAKISAAERGGRGLGRQASRPPRKSHGGRDGLHRGSWPRRKFTASPPGAEKHVIFAAAAGAVYGLEAGSGRVLWRTFVGFDPDGRGEGCTPIAVAPQIVGCMERTAADMVGYARSRTPENASHFSESVRVTHHSPRISVLHPPYGKECAIAVAPQAESDVVMAAAAHREVLRVEAATGRVKWRYAVAEGLCGDPVVADDQVLVATRSGRLVAIDAAMGNSAGFVQFPQSPGRRSGRRSVAKTRLPGGRQRQPVRSGNTRASLLPGLPAGTWARLDRGAARGIRRLPACCGQ